MFPFARRHNIRGGDQKLMKVQKLLSKTHQNAILVMPQNK